MKKVTMLKHYRNLSGADCYLVGFTYDGKLWAVNLPSIPPRFISYEKASRNQGYGLRLRLKKAHKEQLLKKAVCVGVADDLTADPKHNKGENFERIVFNRYGREWSKDCTAFTVCGDIKVDDVEIQIKLDGATFTNEKTLLNQLRIAKGGK